MLDHAASRTVASERPDTRFPLAETPRRYARTVSRYPGRKIKTPSCEPLEPLFASTD